MKCRIQRHWMLLLYLYIASTFNTSYHHMQLYAIIPITSFYVIKNQSRSNRMWETRWRKRQNIIKKSLKGRRILLHERAWTAASHKLTQLGAELGVEFIHSWDVSILHRIQPLHRFRCRQEEQNRPGQIHTHTHPLSGTNRVSWYQKGKTNLDFTESRDSEWQWHQLGHMQVCTSLQHSTTRSFYRPDALPATQPTASKHWRQFKIRNQQQNKMFTDVCTSLQNVKFFSGNHAVLQHMVAVLVSILVLCRQKSALWTVNHTIHCLPLFFIQ